MGNVAPTATRRTLRVGCHVRSSVRIPHIFAIHLDLLFATGTPNTNVGSNSPIGASAAYLLSIQFPAMHKPVDRCLEGRLGPGAPSRLIGARLATCNEPACPSPCKSHKQPPWLFLKIDALEKCRMWTCGCGSRGGRVVVWSIGRHIGVPDVK